MKKRNVFFQTLTTFKNSIAILWKIAPFQIIIITFLYLLLSFIPTLSIIINQNLIDTLVGFVKNELSISSAYIWVVGTLLLGFLTYILSSVSDLFNFNIRKKVALIIDEKTILQVNDLDLIQYEDHQFYNKLQRVSGIGAGVVGLVLSVMDISKNILIIINFTILLFNINIWLSLGLIILLIPSFWINIRLGKNKYELQINQTPDNRRLQYLFNLFFQKDSAKEIKIFGHSKFLMSKWKKIYYKNWEESKRLEIKSAVQNTSVSLVNNSASIIFLSILIYYVGLGELSIGQYTALSQLILTSIGLLFALSINISNLFTQSLSVNDYFEFVKAINNNNANIDTANDLDLPINKNPIIEVKNLSFSYPNSQSVIINDVSFNIAEGERIAIVGANGSGKSTLGKLIMGLYEPSAGKILVKGSKIRSKTNKSNKQLFSSVFQDFIKYSLTIRENISLGNLDEMHNDKLLSQITKQIGINDKIVSFKESYDSLLGTQYEGGSELSGGEWQKIAIARAVFSDPEILVLDEPTASLDPLTELEILEDFLSISNKKTAIVITHRLGICSNVDKIIVFANGKVIEQGNHYELMKNKGQYYELYNAQAKWYKITNELQLSK